MTRECRSVTISSADGDSPTADTSLIRPLQTYARRCHSVLDLALDHVPAYAGWKRFDPGPTTDPRMRFMCLPATTKAQMRFHSFTGFCPPGRDARLALEQGQVEIAHTSGSSGDKVSNLWDQEWWDRNEISSWKVNTIAGELADGTRREAILTSALCVGFVCEEGYLSMADRRLDRFLFLNERSDPTTWTSAHLDRMVKEINEFKPVIIEGNPSFLARLSRHIIRNKIPVHPPALITLTYEFPSRLHYRQIRAAFHSPVASSYGSTETGYVFTECEHGNLHQNIDFCHVDFLPFTPEHGGPQTGLLLVTTLDNPWRVLIRFDIGDIARLAVASCPCGRCEGLTLASIEGRVVNLTLDTQGLTVTQGMVDRALAGVSGLDEYQVVQESPGLYQLNIVCADRPDTVAGEGVAALREIYGGDAVITTRHEPFIRPDPPGKYRLTRALFDIDATSLIDKKHKPGVV